MFLEAILPCNRSSVIHFGGLRSHSCSIYPGENCLFKERAHTTLIVERTIISKTYTFPPGPPGLPWSPPAPPVPPLGPLIQSPPGAPLLRYLHYCHTSVPTIACPTHKNALWPASLGISSLTRDEHGERYSWQEHTSYQD